MQMFSIDYIKHHQHQPVYNQIMQLASRDSRYAVCQGRVKMQHCFGFVTLEMFGTCLDAHR